MVVMYSSIKLKFNIILSICKHFANNLGLHILNCRLSEGPVQGSPFITHLGDGDPNLQPHPQYLYRSSTPEEEQTLQLVIPGLDQSGSGENLLNNSGDNKEENTSGTVHAQQKIIDHLDYTVCLYNKDVLASFKLTGTWAKRAKISHAIFW